MISLWTSPGWNGKVYSVNCFNTELKSMLHCQNYSVPWYTRVFFIVLCFKGVVHLMLKKHIRKSKKDNDAKYFYIQWTIRIMHFHVKVRSFSNSVIQQFNCAFLFLIQGFSLYHYFSPFSPVSTSRILISDPPPPNKQALCDDQHKFLQPNHDFMSKRSLTTHWTRHV